MTTQPGGTEDENPTEAVGNPLTPEEVARRRARSAMNDDGDASHQGGAGAQGGQVDFGLPKNFS